MKKAYIIPLVILLLFVSVVPCFAVETDLPDYQVYLKQVFTAFNPNGNSSVSSTSTLDNIVFIGGSQSYSGLSLSSPNLIEADHTYLVTFTGYLSSDGYIVFNLYDRSYYLQRQITLTTSPQSISFTFVGRSTSYIWIFRSAEGVEHHIEHLNIIDITDIDDPSLYYSTDTHIDSGNYQIKGFFDPVLDTYSHLFDPFVHISENFSTYSVFFTFAGIILSVLILIFVTVFIIKRFTGGNS